MEALGRRAAILALCWLSACSAVGPDDREHLYELRLVADRVVTVDYEIEVFADDDGKPVRVSALFRHDLSTNPTTLRLNEIATSSPGYAGVKVEGVSLALLKVAQSSGTVTAELLQSGRVSKRVVAEGGGALISNVRVGKTF